MEKKPYILLLFLLLACTKNFDEINTNPNAPTEATPDQLLPQIVRDAMNALLDETFRVGSLVIQHTAKNRNVHEDRYLWGERNTIWDAVYDNMRDVNNIIAQSEEKGQNNYLGIALILKSWLFSLATDCYGDIPYFDASKTKEGVNFPRYDPQEAIYEAILNDLAKANAILGTSEEKVRGDVLYNGNFKKWRRLANSLRIRYLMRISKKKDVSVLLQQIIAQPDSFPIFLNNADNAVFNYLATAPDQFPFYQINLGTFNDFRASKGLLDLMAELDDERLPVFFRPTPATEGAPMPDYAGIPNGLSDPEALAYNGGVDFQSRIGTLFYEESITPSGLNVAKGVVMTFAELQFLLAEAAEQGYIGGSAGGFYNNGIRASYEFYELTGAEAYLSQATVAYTGTKEEKLKKIALQKWISLYFQGLEAWFDWRRTTQPDLLPAVSNQNNDRIPLRFPYPLSEQKLNTANYQTVIQRQGTDDINTKIWYLK